MNHEYRDRIRLYPYARFVICYFLIYYILSIPAKGIECECAGRSACPDGAENGTCVTQPGGYCFVKIEEVSDDNGLLELERTAGCLPPEESGFMQVNIFGSQKRIGRATSRFGRLM